jgi:hypothetical protein
MRDLQPVVVRMMNGMSGSDWRYKGFTHGHAISVLGDSCSVMSLGSGAPHAGLQSHEEGCPPFCHKDSRYNQLHWTESLQISWKLQFFFI